MITSSIMMMTDARPRTARWQLSEPTRTVATLDVAAKIRLSVYYEEPYLRGIFGFLRFEI